MNTAVIQTLGSVSATNGRRNNLDSLRLFFAALVIYSHSFVMLYGPGSDDPLARISNNTADFGWLSVGAFFTLSGYLITQSWVQKPELSEFIGKRVRRIMPGYLLVSLVTLLLFLPLSALHEGHGLRVVLRSVHLIIQQVWTIEAPRVDFVFPHNPLSGNINGSLWTIRYEIICYALVAILGMQAVFARPRIILLFTILTIIGFAIDARAGFLSQWVLPGGDAGHWSYFLSFYLAGMTAYLYRDRIPHSNLLAAFAAGILAFEICFFHPRGALAGSLPVLFSYLILWLGFHPSIPLHKCRKLLGGDYSYGVYLYGFVVMQLLIQYIPTASHGAITVLTYLFTSVLAVVSWHLVESRWLVRPKVRNP